MLRRSSGLGSGAFSSPGAPPSGDGEPGAFASPSPLGGALFSENPIAPHPAASDSIGTAGRPVNDSATRNPAARNIASW